MLNMLKEKFKECQKMPKTHNECQKFKVNFCAAYTNFPCCPDVTKLFFILKNLFNLV